ncbi:MAG: enoyl-CoA hydratase [Acidimicrobiales bacterium]|nr:enoyl-CoA hydratase [Acidimicrobiales bacterium]
MADDYSTITYEVGDDLVGVITIDRPEVMNAFDTTMCEEFAHVWNRIRLDDGVNAVVLQANGDRAFCSGVDQKNLIKAAPNPWSRIDPGRYLGPKHNDVWKPVLVACHGITAGGAMYWLNEADIIICADDTMFFDPHVSFAMTSSMEPIGMARRVPLGEVMRWTLLGLDERMSATRAHQIGLVSEIVPREHLRARARSLAAKIAAKSPVAVQGTVKGVWHSLESGWLASQRIGLDYNQYGNAEVAAAGQNVDFATRSRVDWELR